jgi:hypothetical protein
MKRIQQLTKALKDFCNLLFATGFVGMAFVIFILYLRILQPVLSPAITLLFVLFITGLSAGRTSTFCMSFLGIAIYVTSWPIAKYYGPSIGIIICGIGIITWLLAACLAVNYPQKKPSFA